MVQTGSRFSARVSTSTCIKITYSGVSRTLIIIKNYMVKKSFHHILNRSLKEFVAVVTVTGVD